MLKVDLVSKLKGWYPSGTRIRLVKMEDDQAVKPGTFGTVQFVDDIGTIHVKWDDGRTLGLIPDVDEFVII